MLDLQLLVLCYGDEAVFEEVRRLDVEGLVPMRAIGYSDDMVRLMRAADLVFTKPGPGTCGEALAMGCGLLIDASDVMPQEKEVLATLTAWGVARPVRNASDLVAHAEALTTNARDALVAALSKVDLAGGLEAFGALLDTHLRRAQAN